MYANATCFCFFVATRWAFDALWYCAGRKLLSVTPMLRTHRQLPARCVWGRKGGGESGHVNESLETLLQACILAEY